MRVLYLPQLSGNFSGEMKCNCSILNWKISEKEDHLSRQCPHVLVRPNCYHCIHKASHFQNGSVVNFKLICYLPKLQTYKQSSSSVEFKNFKFTGPDCNSLLNCAVPENILPTPWMVKLEIPRGWGGWVKG